MIKFLVVDDEKGIAKILKDYFTRRSFYVKTATSGEEALSLLRTEDFKVIFLDITMKGMSGIETLKEIKTIDKNIKVIMLTVHHEKELMEKARSLGADEYITKPFHMDYLDEVVIKKVQELLRGET